MCIGYSGARLTMKKFLSIAMVAVMLLATFSVVALADAPKAADYLANNGYIIDGANAPAVFSDSANGLKIVNGGEYTSGANCGGVVSSVKYDLNGFEATIFFEVAPEVTTNTNCWVATDFLAAPRGFHTGNFNVENGGNQGIMNLIRFGRPYFEAYEGVTSFAQTYHTQKLDATINNMFYITSGTTLKVTVDRTAEGKYTLTYAREGFEDFTVPYEYDVASVFPDGKAHFAVITNCAGTDNDDWTYYITDIKNGVEMTAEEIEAIAAAKAAAELAANTEDANAKIAKAEEKIAEIAADVEASGSDVALGKLEEANAAVEEAKAAVEAAEFDSIDDLLNGIDDLVYEAKKAAKDAAPKEDEVVGDDKAETNEGEGTTVDTTEEGGFPVVPVVIIVVVVVAVVAVAVIFKKKK